MILLLMNIKIEILNPMKTLKVLFIALLALGLSSCLTVEKKEYTFELTDKTAGRLTIKYINIMADLGDDEVDGNADFTELINNYIEGESLKEEFPNAKIISKEIFEENGVLNGKVVVEFSDLNAVKLFKYNKSCPYIYFFGGGNLSTETYTSSNGEKAPDYISAAIWDKKSKLLTLTTNVTTPTEKTISLLPNFKEWEKNK